MARINVIGISGKVGSGKSFIAEHISNETGIKLIKLDYQAALTANKPILKQMLQRTLKLKIPKACEGIQLFPLMRYMERDFSKLEFSLFCMYLNRKVKKLIKKSKEPLIIDFVALPILKITKTFDKMYLIESNEYERLIKLGERDSMSEEETRKTDKLIEPYYRYNNAFPFDEIIYNDYQILPDAVKEIIIGLTSKT